MVMALSCAEVHLGGGAMLLIRPCPAKRAELRTFGDPLPFRNRSRFRAFFCGGYVEPLLGQYRWNKAELSDLIGPEAMDRHERAENYCRVSALDLNSAGTSPEDHGDSARRG